MKLKTRTNNFSFLFWELKTKILKSRTKNIYNGCHFIIMKKILMESGKGTQGNVIIFYILFLKVGGVTYI